jgi:3'(2'), 5'-bisphosphate nucleotidase
MRQDDVAALIPPLLDLTALAGRAIMAIYGRGGAGLNVARKEDESPLTEADLAAHRVLLEGLHRIAPGIPVVSEEDTEPGAAAAASPLFWLVDPLDGTKEFIARNGEFTVNVALVEQGFPVLGAVLAPALEVAFWGGLQHGAFRRRGPAGAAEPIRVAAPVAPGGTHRVVASRNHLTPDTEAFIARLGATDLVQAGSSLKFCRIAEGAADVYPRLAPTCEWDTAAAQAVVEGAGGHVVDLQGRRLRYGKAEGILNPHFVAGSTAFVA